MRMQLLVAAMNAEPLRLAEEMHLDSDAVIVNQTDRYDYEELTYKGHTVRFFSMAERGVGLSRNHALLRADAEISLFADEDIVYVPGYEKKVLDAFAEHPDADMLLFNVQAMPGRETYHIETFSRVHLYNCGRYPTYSMAVRTAAVHRRNITFSLLFGGGAKYSNGEDSLFIRECIKKGMKVYAVPIRIGAERERESTWFKGFHEKFFYDRGVLYHYLYGRLKKPMAIRFLLKHKDKAFGEISMKEAWKIMCRGMKEAV